MKKLLSKLWVIVIAITLVGCGGLIVGSQKECEDYYDHKIYQKVFSICMKGQRHTTGTDDADDFVAVCNNSAIRQANNSRNCETVYWYCYDDMSLSFDWTRGGRSGNCSSKPRVCEVAETEDEKEACHWYGYRGKYENAN